MSEDGSGNGASRGSKTVPWSIGGAITAMTSGALKNWVRHRLFRSRKRESIVWEGDHSSWEVACAASTGYTSETILEKVRSALLEVKEGRAAFERDSVLFDKPDYVWPLVALLSRVAVRDHNRLSVMDFGGSLGSTYFQHRRFFDWLDDMSWSVVEQEHFVACGHREFAGDGLYFYESVTRCLADQSPNVILLSSVLPYLENPYTVLDELIQLGIPNMLVDRTPVLTTGDRDRLTVQTVPPNIYDASYPAWILSRNKLMDFFGNDFSLVAEFDAIDGVATLCNPQDTAPYLGWFFERKDSVSEPE